MTKTFFCRSCQRHKPIDQATRERSFQHQKTCLACDDKITRAKAKKLPPAAKVYQEKKIKFIVPMAY